LRAQVVTLGSRLQQEREELQAKAAALQIPLQAHLTLRPSQEQLIQDICATTPTNHDDILSHLRQIEVENKRMQAQLDPSDRSLEAASTRAQRFAILERNVSRPIVLQPAAPAQEFSMLGELAKEVAVEDVVTDVAFKHDNVHHGTTDLIISPTSHQTPTNPNQYSGRSSLPITPASQTQPNRSSANHRLPGVPVTIDMLRQQLRRGSSDHGIPKSNSVSTSIPLTVSQLHHVTVDDDAQNHANSTEEPDWEVTREPKTRQILTRRSEVPHTVMSRVLSRQTHRDSLHMPHPERLTMREKLHRFAALINNPV
jgi:hypothetical protein